MLKKHAALGLVLFLFLTGCHFHLRSPVTLAEPLHNIYVQSQNPYGNLTRNIKQYLRMAGVHLAATPEEASTILTILQETSSQDLLSINSSQQTRQYSLKLLVTFELLKSRGNISLAPQSVMETRPLTLQSNQILAGSNQAAQLYSDMRRAIVYDIMTRLASQDVTKALLSTAAQAQP